MNHLRRERERGKTSHQSLGSFCSSCVQQASLFHIHRAATTGSQLGVQRIAFAFLLIATFTCGPSQKSPSDPRSEVGVGWTVCSRSLVPKSSPTLPDHTTPPFASTLAWKASLLIVSHRPNHRLVPHITQTNDELTETRK